jgi:hypothetical protein
MENRNNPVDQVPLTYDEFENLAKIKKLEATVQSLKELLAIANEFRKQE